MRVALKHNNVVRSLSNSHEKKGKRRPSPGMSKRVKKEATNSRQKKRMNELLTSPVKSTSKKQLPLKTILHTFLSLATKESEKKEPPSIERHAVPRPINLPLG